MQLSTRLTLFDRNTAAENGPPTRVMVTAYAKIDVPDLALDAGNTTVQTSEHSLVLQFPGDDQVVQVKIPLDESDVPSLIRSALEAAEADIAARARRLDGEATGDA